MSAMIVLLMVWKYALPESQSGRNMSAMIVLLTVWKYALPESQKWQKHVSHDCAAHELEIRTR